MINGDDYRKAFRHENGEGTTRTFGRGQFAMEDRGMLRDVVKRFARGSIRAGVKWARALLSELERRGFYGSTASKDLSEWTAHNGDSVLRLDYPLGPASVVVDVGGYKGQWASDIFGRFDCSVHIFEPVAEFRRYLEWRFEPNEKITVHPVGLARQDATGVFGLADDATGVHKAASTTTEGKLAAAVPYLRGLGIDSVDLMKINIEGGEYELLEHLVDSGYIASIREIQVQFHDFVSDAERRLGNAHGMLANTHEPTYQFPFIWESWRRREP